MKIPENIAMGGGGGGVGWGAGSGGQGGCERRYKVFVKCKNKIGWGAGLGAGVRTDK